MTEKEKFKEAKKLYQTANADQRYVLETLFPELLELRGEIIRKKLVDLLYKVYANTNYITGTELDEAVSLLKKQGGQGPKKVSIWKHWKDGIAGGPEDEQIFLIKIGRVYSISSCLGCECDYIELSELDGLMREEKQGKPKWTEEDDYNVQCCIAKVESDIADGNLGRNKELIDWLKSIKERMEEQQ